MSAHESTPPERVLREAAPKSPHRATQYQPKDKAQKKAKRAKAPEASEPASLLHQPPQMDDGISKREPRKAVKDAEYGTRQYYIRRLASLELERSSWITHWGEIADYMAPRRQRRYWADRNKGVKRNSKIINNTAPLALRTLSSGMHSGLTSPARPWYRLTAPSPELNDNPSVRSWLHDVEQRMRLVHARSNIYNVLPQVYGDLGGFGTACLWLDEHPTQIIRGYVFPIGSYSLGIGADQTVDTVYRRVSQPVGAVVDSFGYENCSPKVRDLYDRGHLDQWILLGQACEPNRRKNPKSGLQKDKAWSNVWFELEAGLDPHQFLRLSGYDEFPCCCPRWNVNGEDIYGYSPGMDALGDSEALQTLERRKLATADKIVNPPMVAPASLRNQRVSLLSGDVTYLDSATPAGSEFRPAIQIPPVAIQIEEATIREHEMRINRAFFADLWLMMSQDERAQRATAEEVRARQDEKMLQIGPVLERLHDELLDPLIDRTFNIMLKRGLLPPPPQELIRSAEQGENELRVEYISILAQAQKLVGTAAIDRQVAFVANVSQATQRPEAIDLVDIDKTIRGYAQMLGTDPEMLRSEDEVAAIREQRAQQEAQAAQAQMAMQQAQAANQAGSAARNLSQAQVGGEGGSSALDQLLGYLGPEAAAAANSGV
jgi:hypothetical protein